MAQTIRFKRGLEANRLAYTPVDGEPLWTSDGKKLFIGDGATAGGIDFVSAITANYILSSEKGSANGVATLDAAGLIPAAQLPAIAITDTFVVASEAAMLALTAQTGDVAIRTDLDKNFILRGSDASVLADWEELLSPNAPVTSVNGKTGVVTLTTDDIGEGTTNLYFTDARAVTAVIDDSAGGAGATDSTYSADKIDNLITGTLHYQGAWDASTNSPTLSDATGTQNDWYKVSVAGTQDLGSGSITFAVGDDVIHNGTVWQRFHSSGDVDVLNDLSDVAAPSPTNGQVLTFDGTDWVNQAIPAPSVSMDDLTDADTTTTAPANDDVLKWDGTNWVPGTISVGSTTFTALTDTPNDYVSAAEKIVAVNAAGTGLEYIDTIDGGTF